jgi:hypothetical protein
MASGNVSSYMFNLVDQKWTIMTAATIYMSSGIRARGVTVTALTAMATGKAGCAALMGVSGVWQI